MTAHDRMRIDEMREAVLQAAHELIQLLDDEANKRESLMSAIDRLDYDEIYHLYHDYDDITQDLHSMTDAIIARANRLVWVGHPGLKDRGA